VVTRLTVAPDVFLWREKFSPVQQKKLLGEVMARLEQAPLYRPVMPDTGKSFSVQESNFGTLGWVSDKKGYRYQSSHLMTGAPWPAIPGQLLDLWAEINTGRPPECCLVNLYRESAKMGLHQDRDENDTSAAVIGVSLGDEGLFRIGGATRGGQTRSVTLASGDAIAFGETARLAYHGIDRVRPGSEATYRMQVLRRPFKELKSVCDVGKRLHRHITHRRPQISVDLPSSKRLFEGQ
jgi:alkylated DNA repair protein (DNA oxidative demethylase)